MTSAGLALQRTAADEEHCPECGSTHLVGDDRRAEVVCGRCGLVLREQIIDKGPDWGSGEEGASQARVGAPMSYASHDKGLSTDISPMAKDFHGHPLPPSERVKFYRMRKLQRRARFSRGGERSLAEALIQLDRMVSALGLPRSFREEAALVYRRAATRGLVRGRTIPGMVAASIYVSCRNLGVPRTLGEIAQGAEVDRRDLTLSYKALLRGLRLGVPTPRAEDYIMRFSSRLDLAWDVEAQAKEIVQRVEENEKYNSRAPAGTAAAAIYLASLMAGKRVPQERIGEIAGVSEVTIRIRYTAIMEELGLIAREASGLGQGQAG